MSIVETVTPERASGKVAQIYGQITQATAEPKSVTAADLDALRALGWTDRDIVDGMFHGARNAAVDIMFDAFKVENDF